MCSTSPLQRRTLFAPLSFVLLSCFLITSLSRSYYLQAETEGEFIEWRNALLGAIQHGPQAAEVAIYLSFFDVFAIGKYSEQTTLGYP